MKTKLRSLLCGLLALVLVCSCAGAAFAKDNGATPVISVHGMGGSGLAASGVLFALHSLFAKKKNDATTK